MAYSINRFSSPASGITVADGAVNNTFDITIIGKGFTNYGEIIQENLVHMLENFNRTTAPSSPTPGQLWFNPSTAVLSVRTDAGAWKNLDDIVTGTVTNDSVAAGAAIAISKLASGTSAQIIVADSGGVPTYRTMTGGGSISNTGVFGLSANGVTTVEIATAAVQTINMDASVAVNTFRAENLTASTLILVGNISTSTLITSSALNITSSAVINVLDVSVSATIPDLNVVTSASIHGATVFASAGSVRFNGSAIFTSNVHFTGSAQFDASVVFTGTVVTTGTLEATYADLAERYESDGTISVNDVGMVAVFGGEKEITLSTEFMDERVAGVISANPAYCMNNSLRTEMHPAVALQGKVPVKIQGQFQKGDLLITSSFSGRAVSFQNLRGEKENLTPRPGSIIGKSLEVREDNGPGSILVAVGRF